MITTVSTLRPTMTSDHKKSTLSILNNVSHVNIYIVTDAGGVEECDNKSIYQSHTKQILVTSDMSVAVVYLTKLHCSVIIHEWLSAQMPTAKDHYRAI